MSGINTGQAGQGKTALVFGASGLAGGHLLRLLLESGSYSAVTAAVRKPLLIKHPKLKQEIVDFDGLESYARLFAVDDVFCCLGTTMKKAKTREAFTRVDLEYPLAIGKLCVREKVQRLLVVSALGANPKSAYFYNRVKGDMERELAGLGLPGLYLFRPSLLLGARREIRMGESAAGFLTRKLGFLMQGPLRKYRPVEARAVAQAMYACAQNGEPGVYFPKSEQIRRDWGM